MTRLRWLGALGALLLALGGVGAGAVGAHDPYQRWGFVRWFRTEPGLALAVVTCVIGIAVLVGAWWAIGRRLRAGAAVATSWVTVTALLWAVPVFCSAPLFSEDLYSYAGQGELLVYGLDPYQQAPSALGSPSPDIPPIWRDAHAPYGPVYLQLAASAVRLSGGHLFVALALLRLIAVGGLALVAGFGPRLARACGVEPAQALWLGLASPLVVAHFVGGGHNDAVMVGLLVAGLAVAAGRPGGRSLALGSALVALAVMIKAPAAVFLPFLVLLAPGTKPDRWRAAGIVAGVTAVVVAVVTAVTGLGFGWVAAAASSPGMTVQWTSIPTGLGLAAGAVAGALGLPLSTDTAVAISRGAGTVLAAAIVVGLWWWVRRAGEPVGRVVRTAGWAMMAVVALAPVFHPWYFLWAAVPLALSDSDGRRTFYRGVRGIDGRRRWWLAVATAALCFLVFPSGHSLARITVTPGVLLDVLVTGAILVWTVRRIRERGFVALIR